MLQEVYLLEIAYLKEWADADETAFVVPHDLVDMVILRIGEGVHEDCKHQLVSRQPVKPHLENIPSSFSRPVLSLRSFLSLEYGMCAAKLSMCPKFWML